jgi:hypothetical protein
LGLVFVVNVTCAIQFVVWPERYTASFELTGDAGRAIVRGIGVLFLMWNATYPLVILNPYRRRALYLVVLVQQATGLAGESWILASLPEGHAALRSTARRFIVFDGAGLVAMLIAYALVDACIRRHARADLG